MQALGLDADALQRRRGYVCASDVSRIMAGEWQSVWREKTGRIEVDDLSGNLAVQMGSYTEPFNLFWYIRQTGRTVRYYSDNPLMRHIWRELTGQEAEAEFVVSRRYPWMACSLDAVSTTRNGHPCVLDAKHVGRFDDATVLRYTPPCTHQAIVCGMDWWALSAFISNGKWDERTEEADPFYAADIIEQTREFWRYVERDEEPRDREEPTAAPKPQKLLRNIDLSAEFGSPQWLDIVNRNNWAVDFCNAAVKFRETVGAATVNHIAREEMKNLAPEDAGEIRFNDVLLTRNKAGAVTIKKEAKDG